MKEKLIDLREKFMGKLTTLMLAHQNITLVVMGVVLVFLLAAGSDAPPEYNQ